MKSQCASLLNYNITGKCLCGISILSENLVFMQNTTVWNRPPQLTCKLTHFRSHDC